MVSIAVVAAVTTTLIWTGIIAVAGPAFDNATLSVKRVDESWVLSDPMESAKHIPVSSAVSDSNPKLKEAMEGADRNFEILSGTVGYEMPVRDVYVASITEGEQSALISSLPEGAAKQLVHDDNYISTYR